MSVRESGGVGEDGKGWLVCGGLIAVCHYILPQTLTRPPCLLLCLEVLMVWGSVVWEEDEEDITLASPQGDLSLCFSSNYLSLVQFFCFWCTYILYGVLTLCICVSSYMQSHSNL